MNEGHRRCHTPRHFTLRRLPHILPQQRRYVAMSATAGDDNVIEVRGRVGERWQAATQRVIV